MGFFIHLRGTLDYPSAEAAVSAHRQLAAVGGFIVSDGARVDDTRLVVSFKNFAGDPADTIDALVVAAETAIAGKLLYDDESGEQMQIAAGAVGIGRTYDSNPFVTKIRFSGAWTFPTDDDARQALDRLATALVQYPSRALSAKGAVLTLRFEGRGDARTGDAIEGALFAIAPNAVSGTVRHQYLDISTVIEAPARALDDGEGERRLVRFAGIVKFRSERIRDETVASVTIPGLRPKGKQGVVVSEQGTVSPERLVEIQRGLDVLVAASAKAHVTIDTADGRRSLRVP